MMTSARVLLLTLAACGGSSKATETPAAKPADAVAGFHDVLAPLWHAEAGAKRTDDTCAAAPQMQKLAADVTRTASESARPQAQNLETATAELAATCSGDRAEFDAKFHAVHEAFHGVEEASGAGHH